MPCIFQMFILSDFQTMNEHSSEFYNTNSPLHLQLLQIRFLHQFLYHRKKVQSKGKLLEREQNYFEIQNSVEPNTGRITQRNMTTTNYSSKQI